MSKCPSWTSCHRTDGPTTTHTHGHTYGQFRMVGLSRNQRGHEDNMRSPHRQARSRNLGDSANHCTTMHHHIWIILQTLLKATTPKIGVPLECHSVGD